MIYFTVYFSGYVKSIFARYEVISELYSVIMMATIEFINTSDVWLTVHRNSVWIRKTN